MAMAPMPRSCAAAGLPGTRLQCSPASVDLYSPSPASESPDPFGTPVATYTVDPVESVGSIKSDPIELVGRPALTDRHCGALERPFTVFHTPPPAAPARMVQALALQPGEM